MQTDHHWQELTLARFMQISRLHLGLMQAPVAIRPPQRVAGACRHVLRSLLVAGSLGALFSGTAFASESISTDPAKRSENAQSTRTKCNERSAHSIEFSLHGKKR
ncbi:MAG: hypothetical protein H6R13_781 [Proteobacteria bacterium]|nr:hypothetical protein [Pseudomonadota bacterium]